VLEFDHKGAPCGRRSSLTLPHFPALLHCDTAGKSPGWPTCSSAMFPTASAGFVWCLPTSTPSKPRVRSVCSHRTPPAWHLAFGPPYVSTHWPGSCSSSLALPPLKAQVPRTHAGPSIYTSLVTSSFPWLSIPLTC
jgi:hypothetical protein